jgi:glyoxylase-like metal-dependent hydrolase (beta-lactamase superfamily II)
MRAAIAASLLLALSAAPRSQAQQPGTASSTLSTTMSGRLMAPERVTDRVWVMRQPDRLWAAVIGNVTIIEQDDGIVLIDSGGSIPDGRDIVKAVAALSKKPIKAVAITHWHNDHPLGLPGILESFPRARVISTAITRDLIATETNTPLGKTDPEVDAARLKRSENTIAARMASLASDVVSAPTKRTTGSATVSPSHATGPAMRGTSTVHAPAARKRASAPRHASGSATSTNSNRSASARTTSPPPRSAKRRSVRSLHGTT